MVWDLQVGAPAEKRLHTTQVKSAIILCLKSELSSDLEGIPDLNPVDLLKSMLSGKSIIFDSNRLH